MTHNVLQWFQEKKNSPQFSSSMSFILNEAETSSSAHASAFPIFAPFGNGSMSFILNQHDPSSPVSTPVQASAFQMDMNTTIPAFKGPVSSILNERNHSFSSKESLEAAAFPTNVYTAIPELNGSWNSILNSCTNAEVQANMCPKNSISLLASEQVEHSLLVETASALALQTNMSNVPMFYQ